MNVSASLDLLLQRLGNRSGATLRASCLSEMALAQEEFEEGLFLPWFLLSEDLTATITVDERRVSVPATFIREAEESGLWVVDDDGNKKELIKKSFDELVIQHTLEGEATTPLNYSLDGEYFNLFPLPTAARTLFMKAYLRQAAPTDAVGSENKWFKHAAGLMIAAAGEVVARDHLQSPKLSLGFSTKKAEQWLRLERHSTAREEANMSRTMG